MDRQLLQIKKEVTYGVDPTLAAIDVILAEGVKFTPQGNRDTPDFAKPGAGSDPGTMTGVYGILEFSTPLVTPTTKGTSPNWSKLVKACGVSEALVATTSATYTNAADLTASDSVAITYREKRRKHVLLGARGRVTIKLDANQRPMLVFTFKGLKTSPVDSAAPVHADATWTGWKDAKPITQARSSFTVGAASPPFRSLSIEPNDFTQFRDFPGQKAVDNLGPRKFTGKLKCGTLLPSVLNWEALAEADTVSTASFVHGTVSGDIVTVNARFQNGQPSYSDDKGDDVTDVDLEFKTSAFSTDDEWSIVLT